MQKIVKELQEIIPFKDTTDIGDIVLIASKEPQMLIYARVTSVERDSTRKDEWWHIGLTVLSVPPQEMTWTLRTPQMTGMEIFTMGGQERFVKALHFKEPSQEIEKVPASSKNMKKDKGFIKRIK